MKYIHLIINLWVFTSLIFFTQCANKNISDSNYNLDMVIEEDIFTITDSQMANAKIETGYVSNKNIAEILKLNGVIELPIQNLIFVSSPLVGFLKNTKLLPGMAISKDEIIAVLEHPDYIQLQHDFLVARSNFLYLEKEFKRQKELIEKNATSEKILQLAELEFVKSRIEFKTLYEKLKIININPDILDEDNISKTINIYSPISGFVSKVNVNVGKFVNPSDAMFELINYDDVHLNLKVFEKDVNKLKVGTKLQAYTNTNPDKKFLCEIILISKDLNSDKIAEVHCHFKNFDKKILPGTYMNADVEIKTQNAFCLPEEAVVNFQGNDFIFFELAKNKFKMFKVQKGISQKGFVQIEDKHLESKPIVIKGAYSLLMQAKNKNNG